MPHRNRVLPTVPPLTQSSMREAIAGIIRSIQQADRETDQDTADRLGCSAGTVANARNCNADLNMLTLLKIGSVYGVHHLNPLAHLAGGKMATAEAVCSSDREMPMHVAEAQLFMARALSNDDEIDDSEVIDGADAIEAAGQVFDALRYRLNGLRAHGRVVKIGGRA